MNETLKVLHERRSIRKYKAAPSKEEKAGRSEMLRMTVYTKRTFKLATISGLSFWEEAETIRG